jgi:predicted glycoside hydrolase/deacetylase ChbG (UPF0249 family)
VSHAARDASRRFVIFNADDFGYSRGINRGVVEAHERGVVTAATLIVNAPASAEAVRLARRLPRLSLGLHVNFTDEARRLIDLDDMDACRAELRRQFARFVDLAGRAPTHLDSHQHVHRHPQRVKLFQELAAEHGLPLRDHSPVVFKGGFYAQWEYGVSDPDKVGVGALERILRTEIGDGVHEMACHPGYVDPALAAVYHADREHELRTLTDPRIPAVLAEEGIRLISYHELGRALQVLHGRAA